MSVGTLIAKPGDRLVIVSPGGKTRLQLIGSSPLAFRRIDADRDAVLMIDGRRTPLMWLPEAGGALVSVKDQGQMVPLAQLRPGTEVELISYAKRKH